LRLSRIPKRKAEELLLEMRLFPWCMGASGHWHRPLVVASGIVQRVVQTCGHCL